MARNAVAPEVSATRGFFEAGTTPDRAALYVQPGADPTGTSAKGDVTFNSTANGLKQNDGTVYRALADRLIITVPVAAATVDSWVLVADRPYTVKSVSEIHSVVSTSGTGRIRKITAAGTDAPGAAASATVVEISASIDLASAINVSITSVLSVVAGATSLATGDKLGLDIGGTMTGLVGSVITIILEQA